MKKDVLIFDIKGYAAHFRKFYTNSSSLSYSVPPRTTIAGLIAAVLGIDRDTYYDDFSVENVDIAVKKNIKTRKILQSVNYMKITTKKDFEKPKNHTQIPYELVLSDAGELSYRIYASFEDNNKMAELENRLKNKKYYYSPFLGAASFNCGIKYLGKISGEIKKSKDTVNISSIIPLSKIVDRGVVFSKINPNNFMIVKERMSKEFKSERNIKSVESYIYDENINTLPVRLKYDYLELKYNGIQENIVFM
ncbi:type I-B CRISPR-associated protein Cas5 [Clostridium sp. D2Q-14]|uniref:type I-B CRISPR-associated protein Cas5b n=1 Tax=Anaeromonas gelatinilytica TaxID=2683194 RepID=UPI00193C7458|nr:type I-B CRISPR-associated protein Cas5b [Anaeromonas gelatinilytica]MBS4535595.1 type I-B CRISPR-associated protein Cas5 [Anaeromonas gelatinilytica]